MVSVHWTYLQFVLGRPVLRRTSQCSWTVDWGERRGVIPAHGRLNENPVSRHGASQWPFARRRPARPARLTSTVRHVRRLAASITLVNIYERRTSPPPPPLLLLLRINCTGSGSGGSSSGVSATMPASQRRLIWQQLLCLISTFSLRTSMNHL